MDKSAARRARSRKFREKKAALGQCMRCDKPRVSGGVECEEHRDQTATRARARYERNRAGGKCGTCGHPTDGKALCPRCYGQTREATSRRKATYRAQGRCVGCGRKTERDVARCDACAAKWDEASRARKFGLTVEQLRAVLAAARCAICGSGGEMHVDHDHATGKVRGLLCERHNLALGQFDDNLEHLARAVEYLRNPPAFAILTPAASVAAAT